MTPDESFDRAQPWINVLAVMGIAIAAAVVLLTGCGPRESPPVTSIGEFASRSCEYTNGYRTCVIKFKDGTTCYSTSGAISCKESK